MATVDSLTSHTARRPRAPPTASGSSLPDPVGELRFQVLIDDAVIGAFAECSGSQVEYDIFEYQEGGEKRFVHKFRGGLKYPNLVLKRGVTYEDALVKWFFDRDIDRERAGQRHAQPARRRRRAGPHLVVRRRLPGQVVGAVLQRQVDERRDRDPRDRPPGPDPPTEMPLPPLTGFELANLEIEGDERARLLVQPQGVHDREVNQWKVDPVVGTALPTAQFGGGQPRKLTLELLFDATDSDDLDVRDVTARLFKAMEVSPRSAPATDATAAGRR